MIMIAAASPVTACHYCGYSGRVWDGVAEELKGFAFKSCYEGILGVSAEFLRFRVLGISIKSRGGNLLMLFHFRFAVEMVEKCVVLTTEFYLEIFW